MSSKHEEIADVYFHINNGGISFTVLQAEHNLDPIMCKGASVIKSKSPVLQISAGHFGQQTNQMQFQLRPESLKVLGDMLIAASEKVVIEGDPPTVENPRYVRYGDLMVGLELPEQERCSSGESVQ